MKDMSDCNKNNNQDVNLKEEKLFRAMSGVDEDLLLRSEQIRNSGRVHKFPMRLPVFRGSGSIVYDNEQYQNGRQYRQCGCGSTTDGLRYH